MDKFVIRGGNPLIDSRLRSKNSPALPALSPLHEDEVTLKRPRCGMFLRTERRLLTAMGATVMELGYGRAQHRTRSSCKTLSPA